MKTLTSIASASIFLIFFSCSSTPVKEITEKPVEDSTSFAWTRRHFTTQITRVEKYDDSLLLPPAGILNLVQFPAPLGNFPAYLSPVPQDGKLHPAIIWICGGFGNGIDDFAWNPAEKEDDQSAAIFRQMGVVTMYPSQRGGNKNPGSDESFYGEIEDIIAAAEFLKKQKGIDSTRIYLGGHSTGGTKVMLVAEASSIFKSVFSFGPVHSAIDYGDEYTTFDANDENEVAMRSPFLWFSSLKKPLYVFEGSEEGNADVVLWMDSVATAEKNTFTRFNIIDNASHFSIIYPVSKLIAMKILADTIPGKQISFTKEELKGAFSK